MKNVLLTNIVYGAPYTDIFLNLHVRALLDETNVPLHKDRLSYFIFTDQDTLPILQNHPNMIELAKHIPLEFGVFDWDDNMDGAKKFGARYNLLVNTFKISVRKALDKGTLLSPMVADLIVAKGYLTKILGHMDKGHDAVFCMPLRSAFEAMAYRLPATGAAEPLDLCKLGYDNLHPLWVACHWNNPQFTKLPFTLLWNSGTGLLAKSFAITPIILDPTEAMEKVNHVIDVEVPSLCTNPYWATDFTDCPIIGVEPLQCYYPPFANASASIETVQAFTKAIHPSQTKHLSVSLYYPSKEIVAIDETEANKVVENILASQSNVILKQNK